MRGWYMLGKTPPCCPWRTIWVTEMCRKWESLLSLSLSLHIYTRHRLPDQNCDRGHVSDCMSTFENVHHWQKMMFWFAFGCYDKTMTKTNLREEMDFLLLLLLFILLCSQPILKENQDRNSSRNLEAGTGGAVGAGGASGCSPAHSQAHIVSVTTQHSPNCPGMVLTKHLEIKKMLPEIHPQATMIKTIPQLRSAPIGYVPNKYQSSQAGLTSSTWKRWDTTPTALWAEEESERSKESKNSRLWQLKTGWPQRTTFQSQR